ncbi:MAG TPA: carboxypeptidase regulatory-like domain-containing protein [Longimicrobium sp.]|jgi:hypothetical protein
MPSRILRVLIASLLFPAAAAAQTVRGSVVERGGGPVPGVLVALVAEDGSVRAEVLSDANGRYRVAATAPGRYTLRADRVGYRRVTSPALQLAAGQTLEYALQATAERVELPAITATAGRRCSTRSDPGMEVAGLWTEAGKALRSSAYTSIQFPYRYRITRKRRQLDPTSLITRSERVQSAESAKPSPFVTVPTARLAEKGYVEAVGDTVIFHAPDAEILLSNEFLDTHCFSARPGDEEHPGMVGLAFAPIATGELTDVRGVLWMDAKTAELRVLEYGYTGGRFPDAAEAGGRVEFRRLPSGGWIVSRWRIRMPSGASRFRPNNTAVPGVDPVGVGIAEEAGEVMEIRTAEGELVAMAAPARVTGMVWDSTRSRPLAAARVVLEGTDRTATTDSAGRFALEGVSEGAYSLTFAHPRLDSLRYTPEPTRVVAVPPQTAERDLAIPSLGRVLTASCPRPAAGTLGGLVTSRATGAPMAGVPVRAEWPRPGDSGDTARALAVTDDAGMYRFCDLPVGMAVRVAAVIPGAERGEVRLEAGRPGVKNVELDAPAPVRAGTTTGRGRVVLRLVDAGNSRPIAGARVRLGGDLAQVVSNRQGVATIEQVPSGSYGVQMHHEVYGSMTTRVLVRGGLPTEVEVRVPKRPIILEPIVVQARRVLPGVFNEDRRGRRLDIVTRDEIDRRPAARNVGELVSHFPNVKIKYDEKGEVCVESMRLVGTMISPAACNSVQLFLDDMAVGKGTEFATAIPMDNVESVIFMKPTEAFNLYGFMAQNGALLVYTRGNGPTVRRAND